MQKRWIASLAFAAALGGGAALAQTAETPSGAENLGTAVFAGGCFWCVEADFDKAPGVVSTTSGFAGGAVANPTYEQVSNGGTGHAEAVLVEYDPANVSYKSLLEYFWRHVDPVDGGGQFCDRGSQYRSAIFYRNEEQRREAEASKAEIEKSGVLGKPIKTEIAPGLIFYPAEDYHQDYYKKNPLKYKFYRYNCGRDQRLSQLWGDKAGQ